MTTLEQATVKKALWRLMPLVVVCYFVAYLDRANVGFGALQMNKDLGLSASAYGFGAGLFFLTYFALELPSNLMLARFGARRWIARIMLTWGLISGAMAFVSGETSFYTLRLLLGAAEAGFFPGVTYFVTLWFPAAYRARVMGIFLCAAPVSLALGGPVSGAILNMDGLLGIAGWRWLFFLEAVPALVMAVVVLKYLTNKPSEAQWLTPAEKTTLTERLALEAQERGPMKHTGLVAALFSRRVLALGIVNMLIVVAIYGVSFFLPRIIKDFGLSNVQTGLVSAIPSALAGIALVVWGRRSDAKSEQRMHTIVPILFASVALVAAALIADPTIKMIAFCCAAIGCWACMPSFWSLSVSGMSEREAPGSIAVINSIANLGGFAGPSIMGFFRDHTAGYAVGLLVLAAVNVVAAAIVMFISQKSGGSDTADVKKLPVSSGVPVDHTNRVLEHH